MVLFLINIKISTFPLVFFSSSFRIHTHGGLCSSKIPLKIVVASYTGVNLHNSALASKKKKCYTLLYCKLLGIQKYLSCYLIDCSKSWSRDCITTRCSIDNMVYYHKWAISYSKLQCILHIICGVIVSRGIGTTYNISDASLLLFVSNKGSLCIWDIIEYA